YPHKPGVLDPPQRQLQPGTDRPGPIGADVARSPRRRWRPGAGRARVSAACCDRGIGDLPELLRSLAEGPLPRPARRVHRRDAAPGAGRPGPEPADLGWGLPLPGDGQVCDDDSFPAPVSPPGGPAKLGCAGGLGARFVWADRTNRRPARSPATLAQRAGELSAPGKVNDYSYQGTRNESIISFEHRFYRLGMRDREWIRYA